MPAAMSGAMGNRLRCSSSITQIVAAPENAAPARTVLFGDQAGLPPAGAARGAAADLRARPGAMPTWPSSLAPPARRTPAANPRLLPCGTCKLTWLVPTAITSEPAPRTTKPAPGPTPRLGQRTRRWRSSCATIRLLRRRDHSPGDPGRTSAGGGPQLATATKRLGVDDNAVFATHADDVVRVDGLDRVSILAGDRGRREQAVDDRFFRGLADGLKQR